MKIRRYLIFVIIMIVSISCREERPDYLENATYKELALHYQNDTTRKQEAVDFLFQYINTKHSRYEPSVDAMLTGLADSLVGLEGRLKKRKVISLIDKSMPKVRETQICIYDLDTLSSKALIVHIDTTYKQWQKMAQVSGASYSDYCEYILPYRISDEPVHGMPSPFFSQELAWLQDSLSLTDSIGATISAFINEAGMDMHYPLGKKIHHQYSALQAYKVGIVPRCDAIAISLALSLRAIGIPATTDYVTQWGNHHGVGHRWLAVKWQGQWQAFDPITGSELSDHFRKECVVKAWRSTYSLSPITNKFSIDVTDGYVATTRLSVAATIPKKYRPALAIFNRSNEYNIMTYGFKQKDSLVFENVGREAFYFVGYEEDNVFVPILAPLYLDSLEHITSLVADLEHSKSFALRRKFPTNARARTPKRRFWGASLSDAWIEGSNDNFQTFDTLLVLKDYDSYKEEVFTINSNNAYKSARFVSEKKSMIAELKFLDDNNKLLVGEIFGNYWEGVDKSAIFDNNMLTWSSLAGNSTKKKYVGLQFDEVKKIKTISVLARNDGNQIVVGNDYELMVWVDGWKSYGRQTATDQKLVFEDIPTKGLYWLRNHTTGSEELPFILTPDGEQFWLGELK